MLLWSDGWLDEGGQWVPAIWLLDPFSDPIEVVELRRPDSQNANTGRNVGYDPVHRVVLEQGGIDHEFDPSLFDPSIDGYLLE